MAGKYIQSLMGEAEKILLVTRQHWFVLFRAIVAEILIILILIAAGIAVSVAYPPTALLAPVIAVSVRIISRRFRKTSHQIQQSMGEITHVVQEATEGQRVVKIFGAQQAEIRTFDQVNRRNLNQAMKKAVAAAINVPVVELLAAIGVAVAIYFAMQQSTAGRLTAGEFTSYITAMALIRRVGGMAMVSSPVLNSLFKLSLPLMNGVPIFQPDTCPPQIHGSDMYVFVWYSTPSIPTIGGARLAPPCVPNHCIGGYSGFPSASKSVVSSSPDRRSR